MRAAQSLFFFLSLFRRVVRVPARGVKRVSALFSDTLMTADRRPLQSGCKRVRAFKKLSIKMYGSGSGRTLSGSGVFGPNF